MTDTDTNSDANSMMILIRFINETLHESQSNGVHLNTVSTLWIILFAIIIVQKLIKYVIKPIVNNRNNNTNDDKNINRDPSTECMIV